jgi:hypothetical protein
LNTPTPQFGGRAITSVIVKALWRTSGEDRSHIRGHDNELNVAADLVDYLGVGASILCSELSSDSLENVVPYSVKKTKGVVNKRTENNTIAFASGTVLIILGLLPGDDGAVDLIFASLGVSRDITNLVGSGDVDGDGDGSESMDKDVTRPIVGSSNKAVGLEFNLETSSLGEGTYSIGDAVVALGEVAVVVAGLGVVTVMIKDIKAADGTYSCLAKGGRVDGGAEGQGDGYLQSLVIEGVAVAVTVRRSDGVHQKPDLALQRDAINCWSRGWAFAKARS